MTQKHSLRSLLLWLCTCCCLLSSQCPARIPKKIWQTYKTKDLPRPARKAQRTWLARNPEYEYMLWDDTDITSYVDTHTGSNMRTMFHSVPLGVMKADIWRYLIIADKGGIYSDIDSECCKPIRLWVPKRISKKSHVLLLAVEDLRNFCQWTFAATPKHPAMRFVCRYMVNRWKQNGIDIKNENSVYESTGPNMWTDAIVTYLGIDTEGIPRTQLASTLYQRYVSNRHFRNLVHRKGIILFADDFYSGIASRNLYGGSSFGEGYVPWKHEINNTKTYELLPNRWKPVIP
jgi:mannosyltransferase OCH1-like enzyme